jgi:hypothetical protein
LRSLIASNKEQLSCYMSLQTLSQGLQQCAQVTHRDTPCVSTFFFLFSQVNQESNCPTLAPLVPRHAKDHPHILNMLRKLQLGVPQFYIRSELIKILLSSNGL